MTHVELLLWCVFWYVVYCVAGAVVLATIDDEYESLRSWAKQCPLPGGAGWVMALWPVVALLWLTRPFWKKD